MEPLPIERGVQEKMLSGSLHPDDAPPALWRVTALLATAGGPVVESDRTRDDRTVAAMVAAIEASSTVAAGAPLEVAPRPRRRLLKTKLVVALAAAVFLMGTGLAFAGVLPAPMQNVAAHVLGRFGIHVPHPASTSGATSVKKGKGPDVSGPARHGGAAPSNRPSAPPGRGRNGAGGKGKGHGSGKGGSKSRGHSHTLGGGGSGPNTGSPGSSGGSSQSSGKGSRNAGGNGRS